MNSIFHRGRPEQPSVFLVRKQVAGIPLLWWLVIGAGFLLRVEYWREFSALPHAGFAIGPDVMEYFERATAIAAGRFFPAQPDIHAPLYSCFLAVFLACGVKIIVIRLVQLLLNFVAVIAIGRLLRRRRLAEGIQLLFLAFAMLMPVALFYQAELIAESLALPLLALWFWSHEIRRRPRWLGALVSGCCCGLLVLTHGLFWAAAVVEFLRFIRFRRCSGVIAAAVGLALILIPVILLNSLHYGFFCGIQQNSLYNLYIGNNFAATGGASLRPGRDWRRPLEIADASPLGRTGWLCRELAVFYSSPKAVGRGFLRKIALLISPGEPISGADPEELIRMTFLQRIGAAGMALVLLCAFTGCFFIRKYGRRCGDLLGFAAVLALLLLITVVAGRYRYAMLPGLWLLASFGVFGARALLLATGGLVAVFITVWTLKYGVLVESRPGEAASIIGEAWFRLGEYQRAGQCFRFAASRINDPSRFANFLGTIALKENHPDEAGKFYRAAIASEPAFFEGYANLGQLLFFQNGCRDEAAALICRSLELKPEQPFLWNLLGIDHYERGRFTEAAACFNIALRYQPSHEGYRKNLETVRQKLK